MSRLIDADALLEALADKFVSVNGNVIELINNAPTVQREGWVSVPIEPTREMLEAAKIGQADHESYEEWIDYGYGEDVIANYKAMISAAPKE